jgi:hypothetical protein
MLIEESKSNSKITTFWLVVVHDYWLVPLLHLTMRLCVAVLLHNKYLEQF